MLSSEFTIINFRQEFTWVLPHVDYYQNFNLSQKGVQHLCSSTFALENSFYVNNFCTKSRLHLDGDK